jgi:hypothetical protein
MGIEGEGRADAAYDPRMSYVPDGCVSYGADYSDKASISRSSHSAANSAP